MDFEDDEGWGGGFGEDLQGIAQDIFGSESHELLAGAPTALELASQQQASHAPSLLPLVPLDASLQGEIPEPVLQNVIASVHLCTELDLRLIAISARNAEYNPVKVNAVVIRLRNPKCTGLLFRTGRMMITGARSEEDAHIGGKKIAKLCLKVGHPDLKFRGFKIENMIATGDCGFPIRLEGLAYDHSSYCSYEPEMFAGLVYRYEPADSPKAVLLVFVSGKVILTGCRTSEHVGQVFRTMFPVFAQYRK